MTQPLLSSLTPLRHKRLSLAPIFLALLALSGCGGSDDESEELIQSVTLAEAIDNGTTIAKLNLFLLNGNDGIINESETAQLGATAILDNGTHSDTSHGLLWSSSDTAVLQVSSAGLLTGISKGTATITALTSVPNEISTDLTVTVSDADIVSSTLEVLWPSPAPPCTTLSTRIAPVEFSDGTLRNITEWASWSIADNALGEILSTSPTALDLVLYSDQAIDFSVSVGSKDYPLSLTATAPPTVLAALQGGSTLLATGESRSLQAISSYITNGDLVTESIEQYLTWQSDNDAVASIDGTTLISHSVGSASISASCGDISEPFASFSLETINIEFEAIYFSIDDEEVSPAALSQAQIIPIDDEEVEIKAFASFGNDISARIGDAEDWQITFDTNSEIATIEIEEDLLRLTPLSPGNLEIKVFYDEDEDDDDIKQAILKLEIL